MGFGIIFATSIRWPWPIGRRFSRNAQKLGTSRCCTTSASLASGWYRVPSSPQHCLGFRDYCKYEDKVAIHYLHRVSYVLSHGLSHCGHRVRPPYILTLDHTNSLAVNVGLLCLPSTVPSSTESTVNCIHG